MLIHDLSPRDITPHAAKAVFPTWKPPPPMSPDEMAVEVHSPARKRQREEAATAALPRRAMPILHVACALGKGACTSLLLRLGVAANWSIEGYMMPLHIACHLRYIDICQLLICNGASIEARNGQGRAGVCVRVYIFVCVCVRESDRCGCVCAYIHIHAHIHTHIHIHTHTHKYTHAYTHTHTYTHTRIHHRHTHAHTHTHTHTHTYCSAPSCGPRGGYYSP